MKTQSIKKRLNRQLFWIDIIEQLNNRLYHYKSEFDKENDRKYSFLFMSKSWHTERIQQTKALLKFSIERFNRYNQLNVLL